MKNFINYLINRTYKQIKEIKIFRGAKRGNKVLRLG